jgi:hypothetical protein
MRITHVFLLLLPFAACRQYNPRTAFDPAKTPSAPHYADRTHWAALPDRADAADRVPDPSLTDRQATAEVDVFFLHPTMLTDDTRHGNYWNGDVNNPKLNRKVDEGAILYQATAFNGAGRVYAPRYRQAHLYSFFSKDKASSAQALDTAYVDVLAAFDHYLRYFNEGRPFIIAGHSQGARHAKQLLRDRVEGQALQSQLVAAYLVGWPVERDFFKKIPPCTTPEQTGCYCSWRTYERHFGLKKAAQRDVVCTNPILWSIAEKDFAPKSLHRGAVLRDFEKIYPQLCDAEVYRGVLLCSKPKFRGSFLLRTENYHPGDINLYYLNVRENAELRAQMFFRR